MPNQFAAVVAANTKGYGQRDLDKEGAELLKRPRSKFDNMAANSPFCYLKVNDCIPEPVMELIMLKKKSIHAANVHLFSHPINSPCLCSDLDVL